mgnify:FL=1
MSGSSSVVAPKAVFHSRGPSVGNFYTFTSAATFQWTNDHYWGHCDCKMQYVRVYTDYVPYNEDMMISLALMNPASNNEFKLATLLVFNGIIGKLYVIHFAANSSINNGQTIPVNVYTALSASTTTGALGICICLQQ